MGPHHDPWDPRPDPWDPSLTALMVTWQVLSRFGWLVLVAVCGVAGQLLVACMTPSLILSGTFVLGLSFGSFFTLVVPVVNEMCKPRLLHPRLLLPCRTLLPARAHRPHADIIAHTRSITLSLCRWSTALWGHHGLSARLPSRRGVCHLGRADPKCLPRSQPRQARMLWTRLLSGLVPQPCRSECRWTACCCMAGEA